MRVTGLREVRENLSALLDGGAPVWMTRHGKLSGLYLPLSRSEPHPDGAQQGTGGGGWVGTWTDSSTPTATPRRTSQQDFDAHRRRRR